jgi:TrmH family RNA methyltransferase
MIEPKTFGNAGFVARCMKNFNCGKLIILAPRYEYDDDIHGYAMHGRDVIDAAEIIDCDESEVMAHLADIMKTYELVAGTTAKQANYMKLYRLPVEPRAVAKRLASTKSLLVLGREDSGLTEDELRSCDISITIPANPAYPTLNVSHAASIILYEVWLASPVPALSCGRDSAAIAAEEFAPARRNARQSFYLWLATTVQENFSGVSDGWRVDNFLTAMKNVFERATMTSRELAIIEGFLKSIEKRLPGSSSHAEEK